MAFSKEDSFRFAARRGMDVISTKSYSLLLLLLLFLLARISYEGSHGNPDAKRLYDDLLKRSGYNKLVRPVGRYKDTLHVKLGLKLSQLIDVDEKNQIMTTNVWLTQEWTDVNLKWRPSDYGNVDILYVPSEEIWLPDVVLFNNADGNYEVTLMTKACVRSDGRVVWEPPAVYKSSCTMNVEFFPFDEQLCSLKFGSWTYDSTQVEIIHVHQTESQREIINQLEKNVTWNDVTDLNYTDDPDPLRSKSSGRFEIHEGMIVIHEGIDLTDFYESVEWDLLEVPALKKIYTNVNYNCCVDGKEDEVEESNCSRCCMDVETCLLERQQFRPEITFNITIRRKTLFHTVNLILPCVAISLLTVIVFHLPSDSGEKVALSISILLSLTVFFLLLAEIIPPTSLVVPLIGKFLLFTMLLLTLSIFVTVLVLNVHFRIPSFYVKEMGPRTKYIFLTLLPSILRMNVGRCFKKQNTSMPYGLPCCLVQVHTPQRPSTLESRTPIEVGVNSSNAVNYQSILKNASRDLEESHESDVQRREGGEGRRSGAKVITHQTNFVRRGQEFEGGILSREESRNALQTKLHQLQQERMSEAIIHDIRGQHVFQKLQQQYIQQSQQQYLQQPQQQIVEECSSSRLSRKFPTVVPHVASSESCLSSERQRDSFEQIPPVHRFAPVSQPEMLKVFESVQIIAEHLRKEKEIKTILEDWKFVAMMLDRLFFWLFTAVCVCGGMVILLQAPSIYDSRAPLTQSNS